MKDWKPTAPAKALRLRADLYALLRRFFAERGVLEVETPLLSAAAPFELRELRLRLEGGQRLRDDQVVPRQLLGFGNLDNGVGGVVLDRQRDVAAQERGEVQRAPVAIGLSLFPQCIAHALALAEQHQLQNERKQN